MDLSNTIFSVYLLVCLVVWREGEGVCSLDRVLLAIPLVRTQYIDQADLELPVILLPQLVSAGTTGVYHHAHLLYMHI